jgi:hypothetical protein
MGLKHEPMAMTNPECSSLCIAIFPHFRKRFNNPHKSALLRTLAPGAYTAIVRGANNTTGIGLVEVYRLD